VSLRVYVFCDCCSEESSVGQKLERGEGRGWCAGSREYAEELGWKHPSPYQDTDICPECVDELEDLHGVRL
jgi:hypothetical protein